MVYHLKCFNGGAGLHSGPVPNEETVRNQLWGLVSEGALSPGEISLALTGRASEYHEPGWWAAKVGPVSLLFP